MAELSSNKRRVWLAVRLVLYGVILLLALAIALPNFVHARWVSCGVPVALNFTVLDAQSGQPVPGAKTMVWFFPNEDWPINESRVDDISATTDAQGTCVVISHFPGTGSGGKGRLRVNETIWIRADGYEPYQQPAATILGSHLTVTDPFRTNSFPLTIKLTRKAGRG